MVSAWKGAFASADPSRVVIAKGTYMVGPVKFQGPCKAPIAIQAQGSLKSLSANHSNGERNACIFNNKARDWGQIWILEGKGMLEFSIIKLGIWALFSNALKEMFLLKDGGEYCRRAGAWPVAAD
ncbi:hypothetical protein Acr_00g0030100 [Actinidia rufa]|uniref:Pectin lyase-like superfamily protein n=1 Tax=Actinidia rufa TaxID=165716 RepID=A0A7J0DEZ4_9ERIC|nr:hypothetical protein Acr_00g0030100 [Actinidia rufa]